MDPREQAPSSPRVDVARLRPCDGLGALFVLGCAGLTALALCLSAVDAWTAWLAGQILLALALLQWFILLHESGHNTLFRTAWLNRATGHVAAYFAVIPLTSWKLVHGMHHRWTGWQDLDATTAALAPRRRSWLERKVVNLCWRTGLPLFSTLYRLSNFWNLPRLYRLSPRPAQRRRLTVSVLLLLAAYGLTVYLAGFGTLLRLTAAGLFLSLMMQDPLILSQHTHVPLRLSGGEPVKPFAPAQQEVFTRSLRFPSWFSALVLLHFDAHELHHVHPRVPGYHLERLGRGTPNEVCWWRWLLRAKRVPGEVFLFQNRDQSGLDV